MTRRAQHLGRRSFVALAAGSAAGCSTLQAVPPVTPTDTDAAWSWEEVLRTRVDDEGRVDFRRLDAARGPLEIVVAWVARTAPWTAPERFPTRQSAVAFHVNAHNALAMYSVLRAGAPARLDLLERAELLRLTRVVVGGREIALRDYVDEVIRPLGDERVHFALNRMTVSCPRLPRTPYTADALDAELDWAARAFLADPRRVQPDPARRAVRLSAILDRYAADFLAKAPGLIAYVNRHRAPALPLDWRVEALSWDWTINAQP